MARSRPDVRRRGGAERIELRPQSRRRLIVAAAALLRGAGIGPGTCCQGGGLLVARPAAGVGTRPVRRHARRRRRGAGLRLLRPHIMPGFRSVKLSDAPMLLSQAGAQCLKKANQINANAARYVLCAGFLFGCAAREDRHALSRPMNATQNNDVGTESQAQALFCRHLSAPLGWVGGNGKRRREWETVEIRHFHCCATDETRKDTRPCRSEPADMARKEVSPRWDGRYLPPIHRPCTVSEWVTPHDTATRASVAFAPV